jgi:hypothetical protein
MDRPTKQARRAGTKVAATIPIRNGDVRALLVTIADEGVIIAVFDEGTAGRPLIQATLDKHEHASLVHALLGPSAGTVTSDAAVALPVSGVRAGSRRTRGTA